MGAAVELPGLQRKFLEVAVLVSCGFTSSSVPPGSSTDTGSNLVGVQAPKVAAGHSTYTTPKFSIKEL